HPHGAVGGRAPPVLQVTPRRLGHLRALGRLPPAQPEPIALLTQVLAELHPPLGLVHGGKSRRERGDGGIRTLTVPLLRRLPPASWATSPRARVLAHERPERPRRAVHSGERGGRSRGRPSPRAPAPSLGGPGHEPRAGAGR